MTVRAFLDEKKPINMKQLMEELMLAHGFDTYLPIMTGEIEGQQYVQVKSDSLAEEQLRDAVEAHEARPEPDPEPDEKETRRGELEAKLGRENLTLAEINELLRLKG